MSVVTRQSTKRGARVRRGKVVTPRRGLTKRQQKRVDRGLPAFSSQDRQQPSDATLNRYARRMREDMTSAEALLWERLREMGVQVVAQQVFSPYIVDFYFPEFGLVVEVDGGYHRDPRVHARDAKRSGILRRRYGVTVLRATNEETLGDVDGVVARIKDQILIHLPSYRKVPW